MDHEIIFFAILVATMVAAEALDALMDLQVLLKVAPLGKLHLAEVTLKGLNLGVASHMRSKFAER